jgi:hypothetical protein
MVTSSEQKFEEMEQAGKPAVYLNSMASKQSKFR